jgi:hypothetical protein
MRNYLNNYIFSYQGFHSDYLEYISDYKNAHKKPLLRAYWTSEGYSIGRCIRFISGYPYWLPLFVYAHHGVSHNIHPYPHDIENDAPAMLVFNNMAQQRYQAVSKKPCYVITMPYVQFRRQNLIQKSPEARGTLAFPSHSREDMESVFDIDNYIKALKALPEDFHPICVCLHWIDIKRGRHKIFINNGLPVYTAGNIYDFDFVVRFYNVLKHFKYTTSNHVGAYTFYSVEMGIPFSLYGEEGYLKSDNCSNSTTESIIRFDTPSEDLPDLSIYYKETSLFSGLNREISRQQHDFVSEILGIEQGLNGQELKKVLVSSLLSSSRPIIRLSKRMVYKIFKKLWG